MKEETKKRVFSGIQPTGQIHIGNYIGALSLWVENQDKYDNIFCIVDLHSLTIPEDLDPDYLRDKIKEIAAIYLACGIDPDKSIMFVQSHLYQHSELAWILNCVTPMGWLERMTQFKSKSKKLETVGAGLFNYPVLMAADILLYQTDLVPVGEDQKQHIEITRDIAGRFNYLYGETFKLPQELMRKSGARIMALDDPESKMSKSIGEKKQGHSIGLLDSLQEIKKTIMSATTDSRRDTSFEQSSAGVKNLLILYESLTNQSRQEIEKHFAGKGYGQLKKEVVEVVVETLKPIQKKYQKIIKEPDYMEQVLQIGKEKAANLADRTLDTVKYNMGLR